MTRAPPLPILREAVLAASPLVKCISQRRSVKVTQKPIALSERHRTAFGVKWILWASAARQEPTLEARLAREVVAVLQGDSKALSKKSEIHRQAMINRANIGAR
ncbi:ribosomal protein S7 domain-containing protein [Irpex rosettiformis]|uniref:Ribosomal protein S7 domain-containing protein n=1 Tax=Irpex rosettiformis TaxID=378272 RepID=A0ACB8U3N5_9APHY|nr:ribosomal protein S7 domain-containing protein [Irpex rosettiformis]